MDDIIFTKILDTKGNTLRYFFLCKHNILLVA